MSASLRDKSVVVTGGTKEIGKGLAQVFARLGARLRILTGQTLVVDGGQILPETLQAL